MSAFDQLTIEPGKLQCSNFRGNLTELAALAAIYSGEKRKAPMPEEGQEPKKMLGRAKLQEEKKVLHGNSQYRAIEPHIADCPASDQWLVDNSQEHNNNSDRPASDQWLVDNSQEHNNNFSRNYSAAIEPHIADRPASDQWLAEREAEKRVLEPGAFIYRHLLGPKADTADTPNKDTGGQAEGGTREGEALGGGKTSSHPNTGQIWLRTWTRTATSEDSLSHT